MICKLKGKLFTTLTACFEVKLSLSYELVGLIVLTLMFTSTRLLQHLLTPRRSKRLQENSIIFLAVVTQVLRR
jgi:hypothetical protein